MKLAMVAADYTPGEADQLRRDMAAWRRGGRIERHRARLTSRMQKKGIAPEFAERVFEQIRGFGEYGFLESHAASFALIAYATAWLRCHHIDVFVCALLNSQPMGFYSVATIVEDAKRQGVEMRPIDVTRSHWDCTMEPAKPGDVFCAIRMGLRYISGLGEREGRCIEEQGLEAPFTELRDFVRRTRCNEKHLTALAKAGALEALTCSRRDALWEVWKLSHEPEHRLPLEVGEGAPTFRGLDLLETVAWDYTASHHSPRAHPLEPMRSELRRQRLPDARTVRAGVDGSPVRYAGMVISRQRPATAKGVVFMTLEDETGFVNLVLWQKVFDKFALLAKTEPFLGVSGVLQKQSDVVHVVVKKLWVPHFSARPSSGGIRDFQ